MFLKCVLFLHLVFLQTIISCNPQFHIVSTTEGPSKPELDLVNSLDGKLESILQNQLKQNEIVSQMTNQIEELKREILVLKDYCQLTTRENFHIQTQLQKQEKQLRILNKHKNEFSAYKNSSECQFQKRNELLHNHSDHTVSNKTEKLPENCEDVQKSGKTLSGVYTIWPSDAPKSFEVWCDMKTRGGGWIYVINRFDGSIDFSLNWTDYKNGFGDLNGEHWLGLEYLYLLTKNQANELLIELVDKNMKKIYTHYKEFSIGDEGEGYPIKILKGYSGDAPNDFSYHLGRKFLTRDRSQNLDNGYCSRAFRGGFWYGYCYHCLFTTNLGSVRCVSLPTPVKEVRMMIRS